MEEVEGVRGLEEEEELSSHEWDVAEIYEEETRTLEQQLKDEWLDSRERQQQELREVRTKHLFCIA